MIESANLCQKIHTLQDLYNQEYTTVPGLSAFTSLETLVTEVEDRSDRRVAKDRKSIVQQTLGFYNLYPDGPKLVIQSILRDYSQMQVK
jgi:hypothetical protein